MSILRSIRDWWLGEMYVLLRRMGLRRLALDMNEERIGLMMQTRGGWSEISSIPVNARTLNHDIQQLRDLVTRLDGGLGRVDLVLPPSQVLFHDCPIDVGDFRGRNDVALARNARELISQIVPHPIHKLEVRVKPLGPANKDRMQLCRIAAVQKETVEEALAYAKKWHFVASTVTAKITESDPHIWPDFLRRPTAGTGEGLLAFFTFGRWRVTGALILLAIFLSTVGVWRAVVARAELASAAVQTLVERDRADIANFIEAVAIPKHRRQTEVGAAHSISLLAGLIGEGGVISKITYRREQILIEGFHREPEKLVAYFRDNSLISSAQLVAYDEATRHFRVVIEMASNTQWGPGGTVYVGGGPRQ